MSESKQKYTTPRGELIWVYITGEGKTNKKGKNKYQASVVMPEADAKPLVDVINEFWEENRPKESRKAKAAPPTTLGYRTYSKHNGEFDEDGDPIFEEVEGMIEFFASTGTVWPDGKPKKVKVYNSKGREVSIGSKKIGNGSIGKLGGLMSVYNVEGNYGINLYLDGIQILKFEEYVDGPDFEAEDFEDGEGWEGDEDDWSEEDNGDSTPEPTKNNPKKPRL